MPQRSVVGLAPFFIYVNDLDHSIKAQLDKFANDPNVYGRVMTRKQELFLQCSPDNLPYGGNDSRINQCKVQYVLREIPFFKCGMDELHVKRLRKKETYVLELLSPAKAANCVIWLLLKLIGSFRRILK